MLLPLFSLWNVVVEIFVLLPTFFFWGYVGMNSNIIEVAWGSGLLKEWIGFVAAYGEKGKVIGEGSGCGRGVWGCRGLLVEEEDGEWRKRLLQVVREREREI